MGFSHLGNLGLLQGVLVGNGDSLAEPARRGGRCALHA